MWKNAFTLFGAGPAALGRGGWKGSGPHRSATNRHQLCSLNAEPLCHQAPELCFPFSNCRSSEPVAGCPSPGLPLLESHTRTVSIGLQDESHLSQMKADELSLMARHSVSVRAYPGIYRTVVPWPLIVPGVSVSGCRWHGVGLIYCS